MNRRESAAAVDDDYSAAALETVTSCNSLKLDRICDCFFLLTQARNYMGVLKNTLNYTVKLQSKLGTCTNLFSITDDSTHRQRQGTLERSTTQTHSLPQIHELFRQSLCFIEPELFPMALLHCGNRNFGPLLLLWPWPWPDDLHIRTWPVFPGYVGYRMCKYEVNMSIRLSEVIVWQTYRLTDRQADTTELYAICTPLREWSV